MLVIIGLIVGGILLGADLIRAAELRAVTREINGFQSSINAFRLKFNYLPGDMPIAERLWGSDASCPITPTNSVPKQETCNGNGDWKIGDMSADAATAVDGMKYEWFRAWQHLANAGLAQSVFTGVTGPLGTQHCIKGVNCPESTISIAAYQLLYFGRSSGNANNYVMMPLAHQVILGVPDPTNGHPNNAALRTTDAYSLDVKMDDGMPASGKVKSKPSTSTTTPGCVVNSGGAELYNVSADGILCMLHVRVL